MAPPGLSELRHRNNIAVAGAALGRPMLFVHGFGCSQEMWRLVTPYFTDDHPTVIYDLIGSGGSDRTAYDRAKYDSLDGYADDLTGILDGLDLHDVVCVAHSVSAMIAVLAANRDRSRIGALVLVAPSPRYIDDDTDGYVGGFSRSDIDSMLAGLDDDYLRWSSAMAPVIMGNPLRPELADELTSSFCRCDASIARHFARVTFLSDNRQNLAQVGVPTLVVQCMDDVISPVSVGRYVHNAIAGSALVVIPASGHCLNLSDPGALSAEIRAFLR